MVQVFLNPQERTGQQFREPLGNGVELEMVYIPAGTFIMGSPETELERRDNESPQHPVTITEPFWMGKYPITQAQWREVVTNVPRVDHDLDPDPSDFKEDPPPSSSTKGAIRGITNPSIAQVETQTYTRWQRPVENVSWEDVVEFCKRLSQGKPWTYRLPSEAEWEYACRGVSLDEITVEEWNKKYHQPFHFGETITTDIANYDGTKSYGRGTTGEKRRQTTPVGYFRAANAFGLYDMHGNVWEWCGDDWEDNYNTPRTQAYHQTPGAGTKVLCGGSWLSDPRSCRSAIRVSIYPAYRDYSFGFRVVCVRPRTP
jgi:formylglycine-generating enzyme required for sulfatase activity